MTLLRFSWLCCGLLFVNFSVSNPLFIEKHGELSIQDGQIVDQQHDPIQLRGMSLFWSQWGASFYNGNVVQELKNNWQANVVRAAIAVDKGGYLTQPEFELKKAETIIKAAIDADMYVIVDFHTHDAQLYEEQAIEFFSYIAKHYGHYPNVIYEIFNEPDYESWQDDIKPYAEAVIAAIRAIDEKGIIIVGTPTWSQRVDIAADDPIEAEDIAYAIHFYAGTHGEDIHSCRYALDKKIALLLNGNEQSLRQWRLLKNHKYG